MDFSELQNIFTVANTPVYMYRKLRQSRAVAEIVNSYSEQEIFEALSDACNKTPHSLRELTIVYSLLTALSFFPHQNIELDKLNVLGVKWFSELRKLVMNEPNRPILHETITVPTTPTITTYTGNAPAPSGVIIGTTITHTVELKP